MEMDKAKLQGKLRELKDALERADAQDENQRSHVEGLKKEIAEVMDADHEGNEHYGRLGERLREAIAELEASHPDAVLLMRKVIDQLSFLGI